MDYDYRMEDAGKRRFGYPRIYRITLWWQRLLHFVGIAWHNTFSDECTSDFNCCVEDIGRSAWCRLGKKASK